MRRCLLPFACVLVFALLAGCGNKGPLVLPNHPASASSAPQPAASTLPDPADEPIGDQD